MKRTQSYKKEIRINGRRLTRRFTRVADAERWYTEKKREKELVERGLTPTGQDTLLADYVATWLERRRQQGKPLGSWMTDEERLRKWIENDGIYGTVGMKFVVNDMLTRYFQSTAILQILNPTPVRSTGATLSRGGLFDTGQNWTPPHCGHRNGETMDIGLRDFTGTQGIFEKIALEHAARNAGLKFWVVGERPQDDAANHWHATLK